MQQWFRTVPPPDWSTPWPSAPRSSACADPPGSPTRCVRSPLFPARVEGGDTLTQEQRATLGQLHLHRIDLADRVLVINPGGYVGDATPREIAYAGASGTPVGFTDPS